MPQAPNTVELDEYLQDVVNALHSAVKKGVAHLNEAKTVDTAVRDCKEILDTVMQGKVNGWVSQ